MPDAFKFVIARKSLSDAVPKSTTGDYESFLCGDWEFEQYQAHDMARTVPSIPRL